MPPQPPPVFIAMVLLALLSLTNLEAPSIGEYRMCQGTLEGLWDHSESCQV
jgi:hypothetical protein